MEEDYQDAEDGEPAPSIRSAPPQSMRSAAPQSEKSAVPKPAPKEVSYTDQEKNTNAKQVKGSTAVKRQRQGPKKPPPCNCRIDELARPKRWLILNTWKEHGSHFEPERSQALREKVQEEFFMTPEETATYLAQIRRHQQKSRQNDRVRKAEQRKEAQAARRSADLFVQKRIKRGLMYAYLNPPPILMSPMLRSISDKVLEELCTLHDVPVPKRGDTVSTVLPQIALANINFSTLCACFRGVYEPLDRHSRYLLSAADWTAILTANIYYEVNVKEKENVDRMLEADRCSYAESDEQANPESTDKAPKSVKEDEKKKPKQASRDDPPEKQVDVMNYDNEEPNEDE